MGELIFGVHTATLSPRESQAEKNPKLYNMCGKFITLMNGNGYIIGEKLQTFDINLELISKILIVWDSVESDYV